MASTTDSSGKEGKFSSPSDDTSMEKLQAEEKKKKKIVSHVDGPVSSKDESNRSRFSGEREDTTSTSIDYSQFQQISTSSLSAVVDSTISDQLLTSSKSDTLLGVPSRNVGVISLAYNQLGKQVDSVISESEATLFSQLLDQAVEKLKILERTLKTDPRKIERRLARSKIDPKDEKKMTFAEEADYEPVVLPITEKLKRDRDHVQNIFQRVSQELSETGSYDWLISEINKIATKNEQEKRAETNAKMWADLAAKLRGSIAEYRNDFEKSKRIQVEQLDKLKNEIDASHCTNVSKLDYIRRTEAGKLGQRKHKLWLEEEAIKKEMKELENLKKTEEKTSKALQKFYKLEINNLENQLTTWTQRYNMELLKRSKQIQNLEEEVLKTQEFLEQTRLDHAERRKFLDEFDEEKAMMAKDAEYWNEIHRAATKIQALWKGFMVRNRIGKYRNLGARGNKKGKKKSKKKKKAKKAKK